MSLLYKNITGNTATDLDISTSTEAVYTSINICNTHDTDAVTFDLYITANVKSDSRFTVGSTAYTDDVPSNNWDPITEITYTYYLVKNISIPMGVTLALDKSIVSFNNNKYALYVKLNASDSQVSIIIGGTDTDPAAKNTNSPNIY